jgi:uncharacterized protein (DUF1330 family)
MGMSVYLLVNLNIHDRDGFMEYVGRVTPVVNQYGGRYIVRGARPEVIEGSDLGMKVIAILEFPNRDALDQWYRSEEYAPLKELRERTASSDFLIVDGFNPGAAT